MLSTHEAQELERLTTTIHFQILREHGNNPDDAQELALRAIHNQLVGMVTEDSRMHGLGAYLRPSASVSRVLWRHSLLQPFRRSY